MKRRDFDLTELYNDLVICKAVFNEKLFVVMARFGCKAFYAVQAPCARNKVKRDAANKF